MFPTPLEDIFVFVLSTNSLHIDKLSCSSPVNGKQDRNASFFAVALFVPGEINL